MTGSSSTTRISIITVVRDAADDLTRTIASIRRHAAPDLEYVVIDGASTDATLDVIRSNADLIDTWLSEPDSGIYDAMNKGIDRATGDYLLFLNAGDELAADLNGLAALFSQEYIMIYGRANMLHPDVTLSYVKGKPLRSAGRLLRGTPLCHQAILYRRDSLGRYDTRYSIIADRVLTHRVVRQFGLARTCFVDTVIANYYEGGFSRQHAELWKDEEIRFLKAVGRYDYAAYKWLGRCLKTMKKGWQ